MSQKNIRENLDELQRIVAGFEKDDIGVEEALTQFEKGSKLSDVIDKQLSDLKTKITVLKQRFDKDLGE